MSQDLERGSDATRRSNASLTDRLQAHPPGQPQPVQATHPEKVFSDSSGPLFSMYLERAEEEDRKMVESWKGDADGILVFTGLFSASVATFLGNTYQGLQLNSQDASAFYLSRIYQQSAADGNGSQVIIPPTLLDPAVFSPSTSTIWVNALWFLSLVISLTCALLATMLQQWARHYLRVTQTRYQPYKRARIRTFYFKGVEKYRVSWAIDALPALLHLSVFLFYAGLSVLLFTVNLTIFKVVVSWVALCLSLYVAITMMPAVFPNSPYRTPLSTLCWTVLLYILRQLVNVIGHIFNKLSNKFDIFYPVWSAFDDLGPRLRVLVTGGMLKSAEETAMAQPPDVDSWALAWTWDSLDEDHELEQFLAGVPSFLSSKAVKEPGQVLMRMDELRVSDHNELIVEKALGLMRRPVGLSVSSNAAQHRRFKICSEAVTTLIYHYPARWMVDVVDALSFSTSALESMTTVSDQDIVFFVECMGYLAQCQSFWRVEGWRQHASSITSLPLRQTVRRSSAPTPLDFIRQIALPYLDEPPRTVSTKAITSTLRCLVYFHPPLVDCDIWNRVMTATPDQDENEVTLHILASLSQVYRARHSQAPGPSLSRFWSAKTYEELITLKRSDFPLCTEAHHHPSVHHPPVHHPMPPTSSRDVQYVGQPQYTPPPQTSPDIVLEPSASTPPNTPLVPAVVTTIEIGEALAPNPAFDPLPPARLSSSAQDVHQSAALAATAPSSAVIASPSVGSVDAGGSAQHADAPPAADIALNVPDDRPNDDGFQLHGVVTAAAGMASVDP